MTKRAYLVIGPEGSGTYVLAEAFRSAGCHEEDWHAGWHDDYKFEEMPDLFVFRRSLPHAGRLHLSDFDDIWLQMRKANYEVQPILIVRDWHCTIQSVMRREPERDPAQIEYNMCAGLRMIFAAFGMDDLIYVSYESFCLHPEFRRWLFCDRLGLPEPTLEIKYANPKYYEGERTI